MSSVSHKHAPKPAGALKQALRVTVGVHAAEGGATHDASSGLTVARLAEIHEFGLGVPQRSFIRGWFDEQGPEIQNVIRTVMRQKGLTLEQAGEALALKMQASIQKRIARGIPPGLQPSTIKRKGSSKPLIDTGVLRSSVLARSELVSK